MSPDDLHQQLDEVELVIALIDEVIRIPLPDDLPGFFTGWDLLTLDAELKGRQQERSRLKALLKDGSSGV